ncbi:MAG: translation elongation factor Ts [Candidatus Omnitrophica bacterium]|nr:translation elongation factor Ts [Candidatus Omnitrophota bacterium]
MTVSANVVKELREKTNAGMMDCKKALQESNGDLEKAVEILRKKGQATAAKKIGRATKEGVIETYVHMGGKLGVMVEINCESDFVARNEIFKVFTKDVAMQIAAAKPIYVSIDEVPEDVKAKEREIYAEQLNQSEKDKNKPEQVKESIVENKLKKYYEDNCLLEQPFVKDPNVKIKQLVENVIVKLGENTTIKRFARFQVGE